jgi:hypothetical protein
LKPVSVDVLSLPIYEWLLRECAPKQFLSSLPFGTFQARKKLRHLLQAFRLTLDGRARSGSLPIHSLLQLLACTVTVFFIMNQEGHFAELHATVPA